jgi:hypothetical protein
LEQSVSIATSQLDRLQTKLDTVERKKEELESQYKSKMTTVRAA